MRLIDAREAAVILGVTPRRIQQLVQTGALTNHGTPRRIQLEVDKVSDFAYGMREFPYCAQSATAPTVTTEVQQ